MSCTSSLTEVRQLGVVLSFGKSSLNLKKLQTLFGGEVSAGGGLLSLNAEAPQAAPPEESEAELCHKPRWRRQAQPCSAQRPARADWNPLTSPAHRAEILRIQLPIQLIIMGLSQFSTSDKKILQRRGLKIAFDLQSPRKSK